ncbi:hypothetical protein SFRURICE_021430 [Spodoptera frugiperda]|nr:hypothetical protein SFRURICE_021430 [Spodoptera frugiperda]
MTDRSGGWRVGISNVDFDSSKARLMWFVLAAVVASATAQQNFTLEEFVTGQFAQRGFTGRWISDTHFTYTEADHPAVWQYDCSENVRSELVAGDIMEELETSNPILSPDGDYILASRDVQSVYRMSELLNDQGRNGNQSSPGPLGLQTVLLMASLEEGDRVSVVEQKVLVGNNERLQLCIFGGNGHALAYVYGNNLYYLPNSDAQPIAITTDGIEGVVYNGHTDWVYEEDVMYTGQATWFSTDGSYLAFATFDDTGVEDYSYYYYTDSENDNEACYFCMNKFGYIGVAREGGLGGSNPPPRKVGYDNPRVKLRVVNLAQLVANPTSPSFINMNAPEAVTTDHILGGVTWINNNEIAIHWMNRRQNYSVLQICNVITNNCAEEHRQEPKGWIPLALPRFSKDGSFYVSTRWSQPQADGMIWQHLFLSLRVGNEIISTSISPGASTINNFIGMDETPNRLAFYYTRTMPDKPWQTEVCMAGANDRCFSDNMTLPDGGPCTWATATLSLGGSYMTITCSSPEEPSATYIIDLKANDIVRQRLVGKARWGSIITTVPLENGFPAPVRLLLPPGLDVNDATTKYPVVFYVYSGPNTNTVFNTFTVGYHSYLTTSRNIIYMLADGRGSGLKGQDILFSLNNALGTVEVEDHFVILRLRKYAWVEDAYPFMDRTRVGIWGHSYGGYATLLTMLKDDEGLFQCDTMYTERYMGLPTEEDNLKGYQAGDVTLLAEKLRGHDFFIMHGNADDNVHYQNAAKLIKALQELDIPFEQMSYPDEAHSLSGVNLHRYHAMDRYWNRCLRLQEWD